MKIASTILQVKEAKSENAARVGAVNNAANNGTNNNTNNHAAVAQSTVTRTDTVELSKKSVELASTVAAKSGSNVQESVDKLAKANEKVTAAEKSQDTKTNYRQAMRKSQHELRSVVKDLKDAGVGRREIGKIVKAANRQANKTIGTEIKQAYKDYRGKEISRSEFKNKLYGSAVKKLDSIVSALKDALAQRADKKTEAVKENANATKSNEATKATDKTRVTDADDAVKANAEKNTEKTKEASNETSEKAEKTTPPGLEKKEELPPGLAKKEETVTETSPTLIVKEEKVVATAEEDGEIAVSKIVNDGGEADNTFSQIVDIFNSIDKMVNGFAGKEEAVGVLA